MKPCVDARQSFNHVTVPTESKLPLIQIGIEKQQNISDLKIGSIYVMQNDVEIKNLTINGQGNSKNMVQNM